MKWFKRFVMLFNRKPKKVGWILVGDKLPIDDREVEINVLNATVVYTAHGNI